MKEHLTEEQLFKIINRLDLPQFLEDDPPPIAEGYINRSWAKIDQGALSFHIGVTPLVIECIKPAVLIVNGERVGKATIEKDDVVDWCIDAPPLFDIRISSDQLSAYFKLNDKHRHEWLLVDYPSSDSLRLCAAERMDVILETLTMDTIGEEVDRLGIRGVDWAAIGRELDNPAFEPVLIATGTPCKPPKHASIELYFNEHIVSAYEEVNGTIDYRNHLKIPSAQKGQVVAKKHLLEEGLPGITVFGTLIQPEPARDLMMVAKDHIKINNQIEAVATAEGRPRITGDRIKFIDLTTAHVVPGDVDLKTGNIVFSGDIIIYGSVMDGMVVEALGNIYVYGHVFRATLSATGNVYLKGNAIGSHIYCGHYGVLFNRLYKGARALTESIRKLLEAFKQLGQAIGDKKESVSEKQLIQLLMESKFKEIPKTVKELLQVISNIHSISKDQLNELKQELTVLYHPHEWPAERMKDLLYRLQYSLIEASEMVKRCEEKQVTIELQQCNYSEVRSNGDILIRKEGVLKSSLYANGNIIFYDKSAVCRGSYLEAENAISAIQVGGESGGETTLKAQQIMVSKMYCGRVIIGRYVRDIMEPVEDARFIIQNDRLSLQPGK